MASFGNEVLPDDWDRHWERYQDSAVTNPAQGYRRKLIMAGLDLTHAPEPRVLDIGSGLGDLLIDVHAEFPQAKMVGLELSRAGVDIATRRLPQAQFVQCDLIAGNADPGNLRGFGTHAVCSEVLEHVDDPVGLLRSARAY